jgi:hypothetical protein
MVVGPFSTELNICPMPNLGNGFTVRLKETVQLNEDIPEMVLLDMFPKSLVINNILEFSKTLFEILKWLRMF